MGFDSLPPLSISPTVFRFVKGLNLRTIGKDLGDVALMFSWDLLLYEPSVVRTRSEGGSFVNLTEGMDEPFFNFDPLRNVWIVMVTGLIQLWRFSNLNPSSTLDQLNGVLDAGIKTPVPQPVSPPVR